MTSLIYDTGDKIYYKKKDSKRWHGPGLVIGKAGKQIFVKHGRTYLQVNPCNIQMVVEQGESASDKDEEEKVADMEFVENRIDVGDGISDIQQETTVTIDNQDDSGQNIGFIQQNEGGIEQRGNGLQHNDSILVPNIENTVIENIQDDTAMNDETEWFNSNK